MISRSLGAGKHALSFLHFPRGKDNRLQCFSVVFAINGHIAHLMYEFAHHRYIEVFGFTDHYHVEFFKYGRENHIVEVRAVIAHEKVRSTLFQLFKPA